MSLLLYAALSIVAINVFAALVYYYLHRGAGLALSLAGTTLICIGLTYAAINDVPTSKPAPDITMLPTTQPVTTPFTTHPSLDPSVVSRETPSPTAAPTKRPAYTKVQPSHAEKAPIHRHHFDDRENELTREQRGTEPGAGGCDDIASGGCK